MSLTAATKPSMSMSSESSTLSELRDQITTLRTITDSESDKNSLVEKLQKNVSTIHSCKEEISDLKSKLQMAEETSKLQSAEFSFRKKEYEKEINHLKEIEDDLRTALASSQKPQVVNQSELVDELKKQIELYREREAKNSALVKELRKQVKELNVDAKAELEDATRKNDELSLKMQSMVPSSELDSKVSAILKLESEKKQIADMNESCKAQIAELQKENLTLKKQNAISQSFHTKMQSELSMQATKEKQLEAELKEAHSDLKTQIEENQKVLQREKQLKLKINNMSELYSEQKGLLEFVASALSSEPTEAAIKSAMSEISYEAERAKQLDKQIERQKKQIEQLQVPAQKLVDAQNEVVELRDKLQHTEFERLKLRIGAHVKQIDDVHSALMQQTCTVTMRSLVLGAVFISKLRSNRPYQNVIDCSYYGRHECSPISHILDIKQKVELIASQLLQMKQLLKEAQDSAFKSQNSYRESSAELEENRKEIAYTREKMSKMNERMVALQEELSQMVQPDDYEDVVGQYDSVSMDNEKLKLHIKDLEKDIDERIAFSKELSFKIDEMESTFSAKDKALKDVEQKLSERDEEIERLNALIQEKTKEILALERMLNQKERVVPSPPSSPTKIPPINPAFLGE